MKRIAVLSVSVFLLRFVADATAQTNATPDVNHCVIPTPRADASTNRFHELNRRVKDSGGKADLVFIGDSITQGWEGSGKEVWAEYYARRGALNLGIGSDKTQHVLWRLDHGNLDGLNPKVAVVLIGVNNIPHDSDSPRMVLEGVTAVVNKLRERMPGTKVLLLGIFPFREDFHPQRAKALQVNQVLRKLEDGAGIHFLDFGHIFVERDGRIAKTMMPDAVHLTPHGYRLWAEAMEPKLAELLGEAPLRPALFTR